MCGAGATPQPSEGRLGLRPSQARGGASPRPTPQAGLRPAQPHTHRQNPDVEYNMQCADEHAALCIYGDSVLVGPDEGCDAALGKTLTCPLSLHLMREPVVASDGVTYERVYISRHFNSSPVPRSPVSGQAMSKVLFPNAAALATTQEWCRAQFQYENLGEPTLDKIQFVVGASRLSMRPPACTMTWPTAKSS